MRRHTVKLKTADRLIDLIDPGHALREVARLAFSDVRELFDENGNLRAIDELPDHVVAAIASIKTVSRRLTAGHNAMVVVQKVELWDKPKALGLLFKHFGLLQESLHLSGDSALMARLDAGRKHAAGKM